MILMLSLFVSLLLSQTHAFHTLRLLSNIWMLMELGYIWLEYIRAAVEGLNTLTIYNFSAITKFSSHTPFSSQFHLVSSIFIHCELWVNWFTHSWYLCYTEHTPLADAHGLFGLLSTLFTYASYACRRDNHGLMLNMLMV